VIRLAIRVARDEAELVLAELLELAPAGVEEGEPSPGVVEYALYGAAGELPSLPDLQAAAGGALVDVSTSELRDDWHERWREFHRPVVVAPADGAHRAPGVSLRVRAPWEPPLPPAPDGPLEIVIDPAQAFGTGAHATTRLCLELLLELHGERSAAMPVLDVGTGSGVLAIAATRLGFAPVLALDLDPESVLAARENAAANKVELDVRRADLRRDPLPLPAAPAPSGGARALVLANLLRPLLLELAGSLEHAPAQLIAGGMLAGETDEVAGAFARRLGMRVRERREHGEWASLWLTA
jgi:ribosomal protein L11 methyltransferase